MHPANEHSANTPAEERLSLFVTTADGETRELVGRPGSTVMEIIRDSGIDAIPAYCGGACSCASCHVHVAPEWLNRISSVSDDEAELLDSANNRTDQSRLSCQIPFSPEFAGLQVTVAYVE